VSRNKLILVSLAGMFMLAQSLYAQKSGLTYTIIFETPSGVPYCDGMTVTAGANGFVTGTHNNYDCDGSQTWADGITSLPIGKFDGPSPYGEAIGPVSLNDNIGVLLEGGAATTYYLNFKTNTWSLYEEVGGVLPEEEYNYGIFSVVEEAVTSKASSASWQKRANVVTLPFVVVSGYPIGTYAILLYDTATEGEYCDFFVLTAYGDLVGGIHDFVDGCGEPANAPAGGNYTFLPSGVEVISTPQGILGVSGGRGLLTTDNGEAIDFGFDGTLNYYFDFQSNLWTLYLAADTTGLQLINWGNLVVFEEDVLTGKTAARPVGGIPSTTKHQ